MRYKFLLFLIFLLPSISFSQSLSKAFAMYNSGNYTTATTALYEVLRENPENPAAQYLLARMYFTRDNSDYNLDSSNKYNLKSATGLTKTWKEKDLEKLQATGWCEYAVNELQKKINEDAFRIADSAGTSAEWNRFLSTYVSSAQLKEATENRNAVAFTEALQRNNYSSFEEFLNMYPDAAIVTRSRDLYEKYLYRTKTADSTWQSYKSFIGNYPESPYAAYGKGNYDRLYFVDTTKDHSLHSYTQFLQSDSESVYAFEAEDSVYALATRNDQLKSYTNFIATYPNNQNTGKAWQRIYEIETPLLTIKTLKAFKLKYPTYPDMAAVDKDISILSRQLELFQKNGLYGFVDAQTRDTIISARFAEAAPFNEGMSEVKFPCGKEKCPCAYVTVSGKIISNYPWSDVSDFTEGHALVAIGNCEAGSCKYGFINRFGKWIVPPVYDNAYGYSEGLALVHDNHLGYGYIDKKGIVVIPLEYLDAGTFSEGVADVQLGDSALYGFIDKNGITVIIPSFKKAGGFREGLAPVSDVNGLWGFIDHTGKWVIKPQFEFALPFINGTAKVILKSKDPKNPQITVMKDRAIDKKGKFL